MNNRHKASTPMFRSRWETVLAHRDENRNPITRESYLDFVYPNGQPEPWTWKLEARLPPDLQDWSKVDI